MKIIPVSKVRTNLQEVIDTVHYTSEPILIMKRKRPWVLIQPIAEDSEEIFAQVDAHLTQLNEKK